MWFIRVSVLLLLVVEIFPYEVWVDPHDMQIDYSYRGTPKKSSGSNSGSHKETVKEYCTKTDIVPNRSHIYLKRIVNLVLNSAYLKKDDFTSYYGGKINFNIEENDLQILKTFASSESDENEDILRNLDTILSKAMVKPIYDQYSEIFNSWSVQAYEMIFNQTTAVLAVILFVLIIVYKLIRMRMNLSFIFCSILLLSFIIDCVVVYFHLVEEATIKQMTDIKSLGSVPPECDTSKMGWFTYFFGNSEAKCLKYYKVTHQNLFLLVSPFKIFSHQFGVAVVGPAAYLGEAIGGFVNGTLVSLPWGLNLILWPLILVFSLLVLSMICTFIFRTSLKINILHLFHFELNSSFKRFTEEIPSRLHGENPQIEDIVEENSHKKQTNSLEFTKSISISKDSKSEFVRKDSNDLFNFTTALSIIDSLESTRLDCENITETIPEFGETTEKSGTNENGSEFSLID